MADGGEIDLYADDLGDEFHAVSKVRISFQLNAIVFDESVACLSLYFHSAILILTAII